jgi:hypothetical protein
MDATITQRIRFTPMPAPDGESRIFPPGPASDDRATIRPAPWPEQPFRAGKTYRLPDGDLVVVLCRDGADTWCVRRADDTSSMPAHRVVATAELCVPA